MRTQLTDRRNNIGGIHYTTNHTAKMRGLVSVSTDINTNPICQGRRKIAGSICSFCFSSRMWDDKKGIYRNVNQYLKDNTAALCGGLLSVDQIPIIDPERFPLFRFEAFGDLQNVTQVFNYFKIAKYNPRVKFALWTKNPGFIAKAVKLVPVPKNLQIVLSSLQVNKPAHGDRFPFVNKVFTVYDESTIKSEDIKINCGARSCMGCQLCYKKNPHGVALVEVREKLK